MPLILSQPCLSGLPSYLEALREGLHSGMGPLPAHELASIEKRATADPQQFLDNLVPRMVRQEDGSLVPMITLNDGMPIRWTRGRISRLWLLDDREFVGIANIRHELTEHDRIFNGNIGYGIRPAKQGKGYSHAVLGLALRFYHEQTGQSRALLCCYADNIRSRKVIEHNGGKLYETTPDPDEPQRNIHRFWADISQKAASCPI